LPKNLGDIIYALRFRIPMPAAVAASQPEGYEWIIEGVVNRRSACHCAAISATFFQ
jgi:hypothetical protein